MVKRKIKRNQLNNLTGSEWLFFTNTLWETKYSPDITHSLRKVHGAIKPPAAMAELVSFFTRKGERVLDPFAGVGGILLGSELEGRRAVGVDIENKWAEVFYRIKRDFVIGDHKIVLREKGDDSCCNIESEFIEDSCLDYMALQEPETFDAIITDPPYGVNHKPTGFSKETNFSMFSSDKRNFGTAESFEKFLSLIGEFGELAYKVLRSRRYLVVLVGDRYVKSEFFPLGIKVAEVLRGHGFELKGIKIWSNKATLRPLKPYAIGSCFVPNITHQNVLILRKKK